MMLRDCICAETLGKRFEIAPVELAHGARHLRAYSTVLGEKCGNPSMSNSVPCSKHSIASLPDPAHGTDTIPYDTPGHQRRPRECKSHSALLELNLRYRS